MNRLSEAQTSINSNRATQSEIVKTMENMRRESVSQIEQTHVRLRQEITDGNNQNLQRTTDKLERLRDELEYKIKESEKVKHNEKSLDSSNRERDGEFIDELNFIETESSN